MILEELLNKLIEKGWKPFDVDVKIKRAKCFHSVHFIVRPLVNFVLEGYAEATVPLKEIMTSASSGLWQYVCENGMVNINYGNIREYYSEQENGGIYLRRLNGEDNYEYRLIESALCDEDKLEQFLLDNIKIGNYEN